MKIGQTNEQLQADPLARAGARQSGEAGPAADVRTGTPSDQVALSPTTRSLQGGGAETVDAKKVQEMRQAIASGRFHVNAQKVADKMINEAAELIQRIAGGGARPGQG